MTEHTCAAWDNIPANAENILWDEQNVQWKYSLPDPTPEPTPMTEPKPMLEAHDMALIPDLLARVANTIVAASSFAQDVERMRTELASLQTDLEATRNTNRIMQEMTDNLVRERDEARAEAKTRLDERIRVETDYRQLEENHGRACQELSRRMDEIEVLRKERDDYGMKALDLEEKLRAAEAKLAKFRSIFDEDKPIEVTKEPEPLPGVAPSFEPEPVETQSAPPTKRIYEGEEPFGDFWNGGGNNRQFKTEPETGRWYYEVAA